MTDKPKCCKRIFGNGASYRGSPCGKPGKFECEGSWYCGVHDPVRLQAIHEKTYAKYKAKSQARDAAWNRRDAERQACEGVATELLLPGLLKSLLGNE